MIFQKSTISALALASAAIVISIVFLTSSLLYIQRAFGDGLFQDQLSASVGERKVGLFIKMTPPVVTTDTLKKGQKPTVV